MSWNAPSPGRSPILDGAWEELRQLLNERIEEGLAGKLSPFTAEKIIEQELGPGWRD